MELSTIQREALEEVCEQEREGDRWVLKALKPIHHQAAALLGQGYKNVEVASMTGLTPPYVSLLLRQPIFRAEVIRISEIAGVRLEALFPKAVDTIADVMQNGNGKERLQAVRLHGELTNRIGRGDRPTGESPDTMGRLESLAGRLEDLARGARADAGREAALEHSREVAEEVSFREVGMERGLPEPEQAQAG